MLYEVITSALCFAFLSFEEATSSIAFVICIVLSTLFMRRLISFILAVAILLPLYYFDAKNFLTKELKASFNIASFSFVKSLVSFNEAIISGYEESICSNNSFSNSMISFNAISFKKLFTTA